MSKENQRVGITVNEYIRNRKLSMAGQELVMSDKKVIDVALKYGYESPESFTKAFLRFHGVTPSMAKHPGTKLKIYNRLTIKIQFEGGTAMEYKIVEREQFKLLTKVGAFRNESVSKESNYFDYGIGMMYDGGEVPEGFRVWEVKPTLWAVFKCIGTDAACIGETWDKIFKEFLPGSDYNMLDADDFELYPESKEDNCFCEIWVPVERK